jgi:hypothetical protein
MVTTDVVDRALEKCQRLTIEPMLRMLYAALISRRCPPGIERRGNTVFLMMRPRFNGDEITPDVRSGIDLITATMKRKGLGMYALLPEELVRVEGIDLATLNGEPSLINALFMLLSRFRFCLSALYPDYAILIEQQGPPGVKSCLLSSVVGREALLSHKIAKMGDNGPQSYMILNHLLRMGCISFRNPDEIVINNDPQSRTIVQSCLTEYPIYKRYIFFDQEPHQTVKLRGGGIRTPQTQTGDKNEDEDEDEDDNDNEDGDGDGSANEDEDEVSANEEEEAVYADGDPYGCNEGGD